MPVRKLRDVSEAEEPLSAPVGADGLRSAFELSELCLRLSRGSGLRGVYRYRSIADAESAQA